MAQIQENHYIESFMYLIQLASTCCIEAEEQFVKNNNLPVSLNELKALDVIYFKDGICQVELAKFILKDRGYASRITESLEKKALIKKCLATKNKKPVKCLYITKKGKKFLDDYIPKIKNMVNEIFSEIPQENIEIMKSTISEIKNCISKIATKKI